MALVAWLKESWFQALQTLSIVSSLLYTAYMVRVDGRSRKVDHLLSITASHRELWSTLYERPELGRILSPTADLEHTPVTENEEMFVHLVLLHASAAYQAVKEGILAKPHGLEEDLGMFVTLPIPRIVWQRMTSFYEPDFVRFVNACSALRASADALDI